VLNKTLIRPILKKTPYELYRGRKPNISHLRAFGCKFFILNNGKDNLGKFDPKSDEGIHILMVMLIQVYNRRFLTVEESMHFVFDESDNYMVKPIVDELEVDDLRTVLQKTQMIDLDTTNSRVFKEPIATADLPKEWKTPRDLTLENVIGNIEKRLSTRKSLNNFCETMTFVSQVEPKNLSEVLQDSNWILAMEEELN